MESILTSIKKLLGIEEEYNHFDSDLIIHINSVLSILTQLGVGPPNGFSITDNKTTWDDFIKNNKNLEVVKSYIYLKVRLMFDPPSNSFLVESINKIISELEWRITVMTDSERKEFYG